MKCPNPHCVDGYIRGSVIGCAVCAPERASGRMPPWKLPAVPSSSPPASLIAEAEDATTPPTCASCDRPFVEHGPPHAWDSLKLPSCPPPSQTGTYRAPNADDEKRIAARPLPDAGTEDATTAMQNDVAEMLRALGLSDHARPTSPHRVVQDEILPAVAALRLRADAGERERDADAARLDYADANVVGGDLLSDPPVLYIRLPVNVVFNSDDTARAILDAARTPPAPAPHSTETSEPHTATDVG